MTMLSVNARYSADPDDIGAQVELFGVPLSMITFGGEAVLGCHFKDRLAAPSEA